jgi:hypothetical protein
MKWSLRFMHRFTQIKAVGIGFYISYVTN